MHPGVGHGQAELRKLSGSVPIVTAVLDNQAISDRDGCGTTARRPGSLGRQPGLLRDAADRGAAVVVATHDPEVVELCDRVVRLVDGRPVELTPDDVGDTVA
jgi:uncharacterized protein with von Willebrand factor type A (vWA) domain